MSLEPAASLSAPTEVSSSSITVYSQSTSLDSESIYDITLPEWDHHSVTDIRRQLHSRNLPPELVDENFKLAPMSTSFTKFFSALASKDGKPQLGGRTIDNEILTRKYDELGYLEIIAQTIFLPVIVLPGCDWMTLMPPRDLSEPAEAVDGVVGDYLGIGRTVWAFMVKVVMRADGRLREGLQKGLEVPPFIAIDVETNYHDVVDRRYFPSKKFRISPRSNLNEKFGTPGQITTEIWVRRNQANSQGNSEDPTEKFFEALPLCDQLLVRVMLGGGAGFSIANAGVAAYRFEQAA